MVPLQPVEPFRLGAGAQLAAGLLGQSTEVVRVPVVQPLDLLGLPEPLRRVLPDRLQHAVARLAPKVRCDQRLLDQSGQDREHRTVVSRDLFGGGQAEPTGEDREPTQQPLLVPGQQVVAPVQRRGHGPVPFRPVPAADQAEGRAQPVEQGRRRQQPGVGGGQLQGQRQPVQPPADRRHRGRGGGGELQSGVDRAGALQEHLGGR